MSSKNPLSPIHPLWILPLVLAMSSCSTMSPSPAPEAHSANYAVLINGGGRPRINFQSHLTHVRGFVEILENYGIPQENMVVFSGDGSDPGADLATREVNDLEDFWLLTKRAQQVLRPQIEYVDSKVDGYELQPAKREAIEKWFTENARKFRPGDTLFFYVTDHGEINKDDLTDNTIVLWKEKMSVSELRRIFSILPRDLRIVMLMSQCFSGSFASLAMDGRDTCGYFASSADRPAYGCYPENRGVDGVGHSHHFLGGLDRLGTLPKAQDHVLVFDDSPDVPHVSSDVYLKNLLTVHAGDRDLDEVVDEYLAIAWSNRGDWEPEIRQLDRIGQAYGVFSPRSLAELRRQTEVLPKVSTQLTTYADRWNEALDSVRQQNLNEFLDGHEEWREKLSPKSLKEMSGEERTALTAQLLEELGPYSRENSARMARMELLAQRADDAAAAAYRMEVRLGVLLRMHNLLTTIAGRVYLEESATDWQRTEYERLRSCENLELVRVERERPWWALFSSGEARPEDIEAPNPFPRLDDDQKLVKTVMPAWMGIRYRPPNEDQQKREKRSPGAVTVMTVYPESAAGKAGIQVGDVILGPPDDPFEEPNEIREWTMQSEIGEPAPLNVRRGDDVIELTLLPDPFPIEMPKLPGPPKKGSAAPSLDLTSYRGNVELREGRSTMLFFWATWCGPCKFALPTLLETAREKDLDVIAITDEPPETLDKFFATFEEPFPKRVATDPYRQSFLAYGVSGTPTFVLIDADGVVQHYATGYNAKVGLNLP